MSRPFVLAITLALGAMVGAAIALSIGWLAEVSP
jgi:hypothetical protein